MEIKNSEVFYSNDIKRDFENCQVMATVVQLIRDSALFRRQLKELLVGKRGRELPKVGTLANIKLLYEEHGSLEIDIQISVCILSYVVMD